MHASGARALAILFMLGALACNAHKTGSSQQSARQDAAVDARIEFLPGLDRCYRIWVSPGGKFVGGQLFPDIEPIELVQSPPRDGSRARVYELDKARHLVLERATGKLREEAGILIAPPNDQGESCRLEAGEPPRVVGPQGRGFDLSVPKGTRLAHLLADNKCERFVARFKETRHLGNEHLVGLDGKGKRWERVQFSFRVSAISPDGTQLAVGSFLLPTIGDPKAEPIEHQGIVVLDWATGEPTRVIDLHGRTSRDFRQLDFSRDGRQLIALSHVSLLVADLAGPDTPAPREIHTHFASSYALSGDGQGRVLALYSTAAAADSFAMQGMKSGASLCGLYEIDSRAGKQGPLRDPRLKDRCPRAIEYGPGGSILIPTGSGARGKAQDD